MNITELNLTDILLFIITLAISVIAIKISFTFNINEYLKTRKKDIDNKIKNYCPHGHVSVSDKEVKFQSAFNSPVGTTSYVCQRCQLVVSHIDENNEQERILRLLQDSKAYSRREKIFHKLLKKGGYI